MSEKLGFFESLRAVLLLFVLCTFLPTLFMFPMRETITPLIYWQTIATSILGLVSFLGIIMVIAEIEGDELKIYFVKKEEKKNG